MAKELSERIVWLEKKSLRRVLGVGDLFGVGYGDVGSSIYYALGATALFALGATPLALMLAGFVFVCTSFSYAELGATFPEPGGSATYTRYAFNDLISFIAGWALLLDYIVTMAISAFTIPPYVRTFGKGLGLDIVPSTFMHVGITVLILMGLYFLNLVGIRQSGRVNFLLAVLTAISQALVVGFGVFVLINLPHVIDQLKIGVQADWSPSWGEFFKGTAMAMVAYTGIEAIAQLAGETKKPQTAVPRAIKRTVYILLAMYLGISLVAMSVISPHELGTTYLEDPIAGIVSQFPGVGHLLAPAFGLIAAIILLIASNAGLLGCSRLAFSMGQYYQVPSIFYKLHNRFRTPYVSLAIFTLLGCFVVVMSRGRMLFLADLYNIGAQIAFFSTHIALIVLRIQKPDLERPYRAPLNISIGKQKSIPLTAVVGAICNLLVLGLIVVTKPEGRNVSIGWLAIGLFMYWLYRKKKKLAMAGQVKMHKVKIPEYSPIAYKNILVAVRAIDDTEALQTACQLARLHKADLTALYVLEIPDALPMHVEMPKREAIGEEALKRAQGVAGEYQVNIQLEMVRARSTEHTINHLIDSEKFDLVVIGMGAQEFRSKKPFAVETRKILNHTPCRVLFCRSRK